MKPIITLDENHIYRVDGIVKLSVTQILKAEGYYGYLPDNTFAMSRGSEVHKAVELFEKNDLADYSPDVWFAPYLEAWKKFKRDYLVEVLFSEERIYSKIWDFAGTLDLIAKIKGSVDLADLKTGFDRPCYSLQTGMYQQGAVEHLGVKTKNRWGIILQANGEPLVKKYDNKNDENIWKSAVIGHKWKLQNNLIKEVA